MLASHSGSEGCAPLVHLAGRVWMSLHRIPRCSVPREREHSCADEVALCRYNSGFSPRLRANQVGQVAMRLEWDWPRMTQACLHVAGLNSRVLAIAITVYSGELRGGC